MHGSELVSNSHFQSKTGTTRVEDSLAWERELNLPQKAFMMASSTALVAEKSHDYQYSRHFGALFHSWRHLLGGRDNQDFTLVWIQAFIPFAHVWKRTTPVQLSIKSSSFPTLCRLGLRLAPTLNFKVHRIQWLKLLILLIFSCMVAHDFKINITGWKRIIKVAWQTRRTIEVTYLSNMTKMCKLDNQVVCVLVATGYNGTKNGN